LQTRHLFMVALFACTLAQASAQAEDAAWPAGSGGDAIPSMGLKNFAPPTLLAANHPAPAIAPGHVAVVLTRPSDAPAQIGFPTGINATQFKGPIFIPLTKGMVKLVEGDEGFEPSLDESWASTAQAAPSCASPPAGDGAEADEAVAPGDEEADSDDPGDGDDGEEEQESQVAGAAPNAEGHRYSTDISDAELERLWKENRAALGTVSVGFTDAGRLINGQAFPCDGPWQVPSPEKTWGTDETINYLKVAIQSVAEQFPGGDKVRVNHIGRREGGYLRPHRSHQSGRDVDVGFYYKAGQPGARVRDRGSYMDLARNWAFIRAITTMTDVQMILVDRRIQKVLYDYALSIGEDRAWLDSLFRAGGASLIKHARHHRDHFHVRFFNPRAQEMGRRVQPLLAKDPQAKHVVSHRIRRGDTLSRIARKYGVSVAGIRAANGLRRSSGLRAGRVLAIPVRGACTNCPLPPPVVVPPRRLPPPKPALSRRDAPMPAMAQR
jgi:murein endopeptidase